jgi:hypothetical protein
MGVIQNAINQMLGTSAMAARLSPGLEKKAQERVLKKEEKTLGQKGEVLGKNLRKGYEENERAPVTKEQAGEVLNLVKSNVELAQKEYDLNPNEKTLNNLLQSKKALNMLTARKDTANVKAAQKAENKLQQKKQYRSFKKALYAQEDIARLGESAKEAVYQQTKGNKLYRKEIMDKYYGNK